MRTKQRSTFGHVEYRSRGVYRIKWWETVAGIHQRRSETVHGTRREAERRLAEIRAGLDETDKGRSRMLTRAVTVAEAYELWTLPRMERRAEEGQLSPNTMKCRRSKWRVYVEPRWGNVKVTEIRPLDIQAWLPSMTKKPASDSLALLRAILDDAMLYDQVSENVARRPYEMPHDFEPRTDGAYTLAELARIADAARGTYTEAAMIAMMFGSCRTGESLGFALADVSSADSHGLTLAVLNVQRQVASGGAISDVLKNRQSERFIVIPPPWAARVFELVEAARERGEVYLCDNGTGLPISQNVLRREWRETCARAGVDVKACRAARRSWETYMRWEMGVNPDRVEVMMGHALPGVTGTHYDKPNADVFVETVAAAFAAHPFEG